MNIRTRWALVIGLTLATISTTMLLSNNVPVVVKDGNGVSQTFMVVQNAAGGLIAENAICDGQAAAACATVKGSSSAAAATDSAMVVALTPNSPAVTSSQAGTYSWPPGTAPVTPVGTFTTSATAGSNFVAAVQIGSAPTLTTSAVAGSNFVAPVAIGSSVALTVSPSSTVLATITSPQVGSAVPIGVVGITSTVVVSPSSTVLATITSPQTGSVSWPPGSPTGISPGITSNGLTGSPVEGVASVGTVAVASGSTAFLLTDLLSQLKVTLGAGTTGGCTAQYVTASTTSIFTQVKSTAGTLCWLRIINASAVTAMVRLYDSATNGNLVCSGTTLPVQYDVAQPNTVSPGLVGNLGPYGMLFSNGLGLCITGGSGTTFGFQDTTSLTTNALFVDIGFK